MVVCPPHLPTPAVVVPTWRPIPQCDDVRRGVGYEGGAFMNGISTLIKESSLPTSAR